MLLHSTLFPLPATSCWSGCGVQTHYVCDTWCCHPPLRRSCPPQELITALQLNQRLCTGGSVLFPCIRQCMRVERHHIPYYTYTFYHKWSIQRICEYWYTYKYISISYVLERIDSDWYIVKKNICLNKVSDLKENVWFGASPVGSTNITNTTCSTQFDKQDLHFKCKLIINKETDLNVDV